MQLELYRPLDMHIHFREGEMLKLVAPLSAYSFAGGVVMPNLIPPVDNESRLLNYINEVKTATDSLVFKPLMTLFFKSYAYEFLEEMRKYIFAIKLYPAGATTNSEAGVKEIDAAYSTLESMEKLGIPLLVHGETHGFVMDREAEFMPIYEKIAKNFPKLRVVMEHITTKDAVELLDKYDNLFATVTLQHLYITLDDVAGGLLRPHLFCKPIAKRPEDREALLSAALSAHPKLMFGSDSAPHPIDKKEASHCSAGVFTAPIALQALAQLFEKHNKLDNLQKFISDNAINVHSLEIPNKKVVLSKEVFEVPKMFGDVVPMFAGENLEWKISEVII